MSIRQTNDLSNESREPSQTPSLSARELSLLTELHQFLTASFRGASINSSRVDDMAEALAAAIKISAGARGRD